MGDGSKLAIILGCSLGGAAVLFIIILILVCICSRKNKLHNESNNSTVKNSSASEEEGHNNFSVQRSGIPPVQQSQFIRTGSQQWKGNISLTSSPPAGSSIDKNQINNQMQPSYQNDPNIVNYQQQQTVPWYLRTFGRARQFLPQRPTAHSSKRESGEQLVDARYTAKPTPGDVMDGSASAYVLSKRAEVPSSSKNVSNPSATPAANAYLNYGSQTALLPNDQIALSSPDVNLPQATAAAAVNPAYISDQVHSLEQKGVSQYSVDHLNSSRPVSHADASYQKYFQGQYSSADVAKSRVDVIRESSDELWDDASTQLSLPRPTVIKRVSDTPSNLIYRDRIPSIMPPSGRHPTRPDTPLFDPHRKNSSSANKVSQNDDEAATQQLPTAVSALPPRSPNQASYTGDERKIGDAFKFLDEMDE